MAYTTLQRTWHTSTPVIETPTYKLRPLIAYKAYSRGPTKALQPFYLSLRKN